MRRRKLARDSCNASGVWTKCLNLLGPPRCPVFADYAIGLEVFGMQCTQCGADVVAGAKFCHECGADMSTDGEAAAHESAPEMTPRQRFAAPFKSREGEDDDDAEEVLWQGQYSKMAMVGAWIGAGLFTIAMIVIAIVASFSGNAWLVALGVIAVVWIVLMLRLLYRQFSIHYYLTNQRFIHETGILWREIDRIEAIDIDDVTFHQGPIERIFNVGSVKLLSPAISRPRSLI